jgi:hypothetical protein
MNCYKCKKELKEFEKVLSMGFFDLNIDKELDGKLF